MKLVYLSLARIPSEKAQSNQIMKFCSALVSKGLEVTFIVPKRWHQSKEMRAQHSPNIFSYYGVNPFNFRQLPCIDLLEVTPYIVQRLLAFPLYCASFLFALFFFLLLRDTADIYYVRDYPTASLLRLIALFKKIRVVFELHSLHPHSIFFLLALSKRFSYVVLTHATRERLSKLAGIRPERILVAHDAVDERVLSFSESSVTTKERLGLPDKKIIGYIGRFHTLGMEKGLETLIQAMQIVLRKFPETMLCLVGGPNEMIPGYTTLAAKLGMNEKLLVFDYVVPAEVKQFINSFDVCVIPFPWTEHFAYYASPLKLFEYMAAGKPIVATGLPSIREILQDGTSAVLVRPSDSESLANGILRVLTDEALAKKIGENAKKEVMQKYTWEKRARAVLGFIEGDA